MAIIQVRENRLNYKVTRDDNGLRITTQYQVWATQGSTGTDALLHADMPQYGEAGGYGLRVRNVGLDSVDVVQDRAPNGTAADFLFTFTVEYGVPTFQNRDANPLDRAPEIRWAGGDLTEVMYADWNNVPCINSAGKVFDPLPERYIQCGDCTITINEADNPASRVVLFSRTVNATAIWQAGAYCGLFGKIESTNVTEVIDGVEFNYWRTTYPISFRDSFGGWTFFPVDNGPWPDGSLVLLDGAGAKLTPVGSEPVTYPPDGLQTYRATEWSTLKLPDPFA